MWLAIVPLQKSSAQPHKSQPPLTDLQNQQKIKRKPHNLGRIASKLCHFALFGRVYPNNRSIDLNFILRFEQVGAHAFEEHLRIDLGTRPS